VARIVIENLTKIFVGPQGERIRALEAINLTVEDGELLVLVGPSGCGKTTALRLIAGLEEPSEGSISFDGKRVDGVPPKDRDVAMVFQNPALYPHLTVQENMAFGLKLRKCTPEDTRTRVNEAAEMLGLTDCLDRRPAELSGGQGQRVALARAIVRRPKVFLFDEPLSNLDPPMRAQLRAEISRLQRRIGATVLYVTHDQLEAMTLGRRVAVLRGGRILQVDPPLPLYQNPASTEVAEFIGSPPMNLIPGTLVPKDGAIVFHQAVTGAGSAANALRLRFPTQTCSRLIGYFGKKIILGLRPEHITPALPGGSGSLHETATARLDSVETTGPDSFFHFSRGGKTLIGRAAVPTIPALGQEFSVVFELARAHFFDPVSGQAVV